MAYQPCLPFSTVSRTIRTANTRPQPAKQSSPQLAPELPAEIWLMILSLLQGSTVVLKCFRLVCRQWAELGADSLFHTAYLDSYTTSWTTLKNLCTSPQAHRVQAIQWNSLLLLSACLDAPKWYQTYSNILCGASHTQVTQLYHAFRATYKTVTKVSDWKGSTVQDLAHVIHRLTNCRELCLSDSMDFRTSCSPPIRQSYFHSNEALWKSAGLWGRNPPLAKYWNQNERVHNEHYESLSTAATVLSVTAAIPSLVLLKADLWQANFAAIFNDRDNRVPIAPFQMLHCRSKTCNPGCLELDDVLWKISDDSQYPTLPENLMLSLSQVQKVSLNTVYTDPGSEFVADVGSQLAALIEENWPSDPGIQVAAYDDLANISDPYDNEADCRVTRVITSFSQIEDLVGQPPECLPALASVYHAPVKISNGLPEKLQELSFSDVSIDLRVLTYWLIDLLKEPKSSFKLKFSSNVVLYGMRKSQFFATVAALNIVFTYAEATTFHFHQDYMSWDRYGSENLNYYRSYIHRSSLSRYHYLSMHGWASPYYELYYGPASLLRNADSDVILPNAIKQVTFTHTPGDYIKLFSSDLDNVSRSDDYSTAYLYCCFMTSRSSDVNDGINEKGDEVHDLDYQWVPRRSFPSFFYPDRIGRRCICVLMELTIERPPSMDGYL